MKFRVYNGEKDEIIYTPTELQKIVGTSASYYANKVYELQAKLRKTKEELRQEVREEFEDEIQRLKNQLHCSIATLSSEKELEDYKNFVGIHSACRDNYKRISGQMPIIIQTGMTYGTCTEIQCPVCGERKDITDMSIW